jgi:hypothetical protein
MILTKQSTVHCHSRYRLLLLNQEVRRHHYEILHLHPFLSEIYIISYSFLLKIYSLLRNCHLFPPLWEKVKIPEVSIWTRKV